MYELSVTCLIQAPPAQVWDLMVNRTDDWWCPRPWHAHVDFGTRRAGSMTMAIMHGPDGERNEHPGFLVAWEEGRRFAITDAIADDLQPAGPYMLGIWEIEEEDGATRYTARARHWTSESMAHHSEMGFEEGWGICARQLKELCEAS